jgi:hypothetical protein
MECEWGVTRREVRRSDSTKPLLGEKSMKSSKKVGNERGGGGRCV